MEVEYVQTVEDHIAFNLYQLKALRKPGGSAGWVWFVLILHLLAFTFFFFMTSFSGPKELPRPEDGLEQVNNNFMLYIYFPVMIGVSLIVLWYRRYGFPLQVKRFVSHPDNQKRLLGWRRASIGPEGLEVRGEEVHTKLAWSAISKIARTPQHAFIYITTMEAIIVP